jgi:ribonuclease III
MMTLSENPDVTELSERLEYQFNNPELLAQAFRHASYVNEVGDCDLKDNETLEFLGDAVLDLAIGHILMELFKSANEGELSKCRASVVSERGLFDLARELRLGDYLLLGRGEELSGGREKPSILANTLEALVGAIYLDGGFPRTREIIHKLFISTIERMEIETLRSDYKSLLQEYTQQRFKSRPDYLLLSETGPAHERTFRIAIYLNGELKAEGEGRSKKEAEQEAAKEALGWLTKA